jgi:WD40 repeat protein
VFVELDFVSLARGASRVSRQWRDVLGYFDHVWLRVYAKKYGINANTYDFMDKVPRPLPWRSLAAKRFKIEGTVSRLNQPPRLVAVSKPIQQLLWIGGPSRSFILLTGKRNAAKECTLALYNMTGATQEKPIDLNFPHPNIAAYGDANEFGQFVNAPPHFVGGGGVGAGTAYVPVSIALAHPPVVFSGSGASGTNPNTVNWSALIVAGFSDGALAMYRLVVRGSDPPAVVRWHNYWTNPNDVDSDRSWTSDNAGSPEITHLIARSTEFMVTGTGDNCYVIWDLFPSQCRHTIDARRAASRLAAYNDHVERVTTRARIAGTPAAFVERLGPAPFAPSCDGGQCAQRFRVTLKQKPSLIYLFPHAPSPASASLIGVDTASSGTTERSPLATLLRSNQLYYPGPPAGRRSNFASIVCFGMENGQIVVWMRHTKVMLKGHTKSIISLLCLSEHTVPIVNPNEPVGHRDVPLFLPRFLASGSTDGSVRIWDLEGLARVGSSSSNVPCVATLQWWPPATPISVGRSPVIPTTLRLAHLQHLDVLVTAHGTETRLWSLKTFEPIATISEVCSSFYIDTEESLLYTAHSDMTFSVWYLDTVQYVKTFRFVSSTNLPIEAVMADDCNFLAHDAKCIFQRNTRKYIM